MTYKPSKEEIAQLKQEIAALNAHRAPIASEALGLWFWLALMLGAILCLTTSILGTLVISRRR